MSVSGIETSDDIDELKAKLLEELETRKNQITNSV